MARALTQDINNQISDKALETKYIFKIDSTDFSSYLLQSSISHDTKFGASSGSFTLNNDDARFSSGGADEIKVGQVVELIRLYDGDSTEWKRFYGIVEQYTIRKSANNKFVDLTCLDYISITQKLDIDLEVEGTKVEITNENLTPNFLDSPNEAYAQVFDFANDGIANDPLPILSIRSQDGSTDDPQYDGFDIYYDNGQVKLGSPMNAQDNYNLRAKSYYYYTKGKYLV